MPGKLRLPYAEEAYRLYQSGMTLDEVAGRFGTTLGNLSRAFRKRGWPARSGSEAMLLRMRGTPPEERSANATAAHNAVRGMKRSASDLEARAVARQQHGHGISVLDRHFRGLLAQCGGDVEEASLGVAVGPYNVDIAISPAIAVELWGGAWHRGGRAAARHQQRTRYLLDAGWNVVIVECAAECFALSRAAAEYVLTFREGIGSDPAAKRQYRVVRGTGQEIIRGCAECDDFPFKLPNRRSNHVWCPHQLVTG